MELSHKHHPVGESATPLLNDPQEEELFAKLQGWELIREGLHQIRKIYVFKTFVDAVRFIDKVAELAEAEGHHPSIHIFYKKVVIELNTHTVKGLTERDFILAAKIDAVERFSELNRRVA